MEEKSYTLGFDAFLRSFGLMKNGKYAFLLGAGCSISSGLPSAQQCIWDWKKAIYSTRNKVNSPIFDVRQDNVQKTYNTPRFSDRHNYGGMTRNRYICKKEENQNGKTI